MKCYDICKVTNRKCSKEECRMWMDFKEDLNCSIIASNKNPDGMSVREIGERLKLTCTRVKQIQDKALEKLSESVRISN